MNFSVVQKRTVLKSSKSGGKSPLQILDILIPYMVKASCSSSQKLSVTITYITAYFQGSANNTRYTGFKKIFVQSIRLEISLLRHRNKSLYVTNTTWKREFFMNKNFPPTNFPLASQLTTRVYIVTVQTVTIQCFTKKRIVS